LDTAFFMKNKITAIKQQKKNQNRMNIYLDGEFAFGISNSLGQSLEIGDLLDDFAVEDLLQKDYLERTWQKALQFLNYRSRTEQELKEKLQKSGFNDHAVSRVIEDCKEKGYINDQDYANQWVESRTNCAPRSQRLLAIELKRKKVPEIVIIDALSKANPDQELALAASKKYWRRLDNYGVEEKKAKLQGYLLRRGFSYDVIRDSVKSMFEMDEKES